MEGWQDDPESVVAEPGFKHVCAPVAQAPSAVRAVLLQRAMWNTENGWLPEKLGGLCFCHGLGTMGSCRPCSFPEVSFFHTKNLKWTLLQVRFV